MQYVLSLVFGPVGLWQELGCGFRRGFCRAADYFAPRARNDYRPRILAGRSLALFAGLLLSLKIFVMALLAFSPAPAFSSAPNSSEIISLTNLSRREFGLSGLKENWLLTKAAQAKSMDMADQAYFSHDSPDGRKPWDFVSASGYNYLMAGENLAVNFAAAETLREAWMNSPGHKANILNRNFEDIGIGVSQGRFGGRTVNFVVQMFGLPAEEKITLTGEPTRLLPNNSSEPQVLGATQGQGEVGPQDVFSPQGGVLNVDDLQAAANAGRLKISAKIAGAPVKALAYFGQRAVWLRPAGAGVWQAELPLDVLVKERLKLEVRAFDIQGRSAQKLAGEFYPSLSSNYNISGVPAEPAASLWGKSFNPRVLEQRFYLGFAAVALLCLALAIGFKRQIQHLSLIANSSFVVILATLLWVSG